MANVISIVTLTSFRLLIVIFNIVMVSTTTAIVGDDAGIVKISGTGTVVVVVAVVVLVVVVVAAGTNVATSGMTAGWNWVTSTATSASATTNTTTEIIRPRVRMVIVDCGRGG